MAIKTLAKWYILILAGAVLASTHTAIADGSERIDGQLAGAEYTLLRPAAWNGDLVLLVHGSITGEFEALAPGFTSQGYGVAFATLPDGLGDGDALPRITRDSRLVEAAFRLHFGKPLRTYLVGFSRGAHNMQRLLETTPWRYAGMLSMCGGNGGSQLQWDHFFTARVLFDHYFPGVLPGTPEDMPEIDLNTYLNRLAPGIAAELYGNPDAARELGSVEQFDLAWNDFDELVTAIIESLAIHSVGVNNLLQAASGNPFDNASTYYSGTANDANLNAGVARFVADRRAREFLRRWYEPRGRIGATPVILLHTGRDGIAPENSANDRYESRVIAAGSGDFLLRRVVDRAGHCAFGPSEIFGSFADLIAWAESGIRPAY